MFCGIHELMIFLSHIEGMMALKSKGTNKDISFLPWSKINSLFSNKVNSFCCKFYVFMRQQYWSRFQFSIEITFSISWNRTLAYHFFVSEEIGFAMITWQWKRKSILMVLQKHLNKSWYPISLKNMTIQFFCNLHWTRDKNVIVTLVEK